MNTNPTITLETKIAISPTQASSNIQSETVILDLQSGAYYGLNETGSIIWNLIQQSKSLEEIRDLLLREYEIEQELCGKYIIELVKQLVSEGLIVVNN